MIFEKTAMRPGDPHVPTMTRQLYGYWNDAADKALGFFVTDQAVANLFRSNNDDHGIDHLGRVALNYARSCHEVIDVLRLPDDRTAKHEAIFGGLIAAFMHDIALIETGDRTKHADIGAVLAAERMGPLVESGELPFITAYTIVTAVYHHSFENALGATGKYHYVQEFDRIRSDVVSAYSGKRVPKIFNDALNNSRNIDWMRRRPTQSEMVPITAVSRRVMMADESDAYYPFDNVRTMLTFPERPFLASIISLEPNPSSGNAVDDISRLLGECERDYAGVASAPELKHIAALRTRRLNDLAALIKALSSRNPVRSVRNYLGPKLESARKALLFEARTERNIQPDSLKAAEIRLDGFGQRAMAVLTSPHKQLGKRNREQLLNLVQATSDLQSSGGGRYLNEIDDNVVVVADWYI